MGEEGERTSEGGTPSPCVEHMTSAAWKPFPAKSRPAGMSAMFSMVGLRSAARRGAGRAVGQGPVRLCMRRICSRRQDGSGAQAARA